MNSIPSGNNADDPPVTVDILQRVKPGCETAFEQVLTDLIAAARSFEGHLGVNVFRSGSNPNPEYRIVFKFDQVSHLKQWESWRCIMEGGIGMSSNAVSRMSIDSYP